MQLQSIYCHLTYSLHEDLRSMFRHIESELPSTMHLPISSDDTFHFYQYPNTDVLIAVGQFLLVIDVPIVNRDHNNSKYMKFSIYQFHTSNLSAQYKINHRYTGSHHIEETLISCYQGSTVHRFVSMQMDSSADIHAPFSTPHKPTIMYNSPVC